MERRQVSGRFVAVAMAAAVALGATLLPAVDAGATDAPPVFTLRWGAYGTGQGQFDNPHGVAVHPVSGDLYVADENNNRVQQFTAEGTFVRTWGATEGSEPGQFDSPRGVAMSPSGGDVYVADCENHRIQQFTDLGAFVRTWGTFGTGNGEFQCPTGVAVHPDTADVYVTDSGNHRVQQFSASGQFVRAWGGLGAADGQFNEPWGIAVSPPSGDVYVTEYLGHRVQRFSAAGAHEATWGGAGSGPGEFTVPTGVAVDPGTGAVLVVDQGNNRAQRFTAGGAFLVAWGSYGNGDGQFNYATGVAIDERGSVYVANVSRIQRFGFGRPDGRVKRGSAGTVVGNDVYNTTGTGQTRTATVARGQSVTYVASVQNDGAFTETFRLTGQRTSGGFTVRYRKLDGTDITNRVTAGTYVTPSLAVGAVHQVKVVVTVRSTTRHGASLARSLTITSSTHPSVQDKVVVTTRCR